MPVWAAIGTAAHGWAFAMQGHVQEGIAEIKQGIAVYQKLGIDLAVPFYLGLLADIYRSSNQGEPGLEAIGRALEQARNTGELWIEAELCRLKGELLLVKSTPDDSGAQDAFQEAVEIARRQHARSWELRAAMSQCRLFQRQGKQTEGRQILEEIYNWFTEGFETTDLKEARMLLKELE